MSTTTTIKIRRDEVRPGDVLHSSHGYRLLVTEVRDTAINRVDDRHVEIVGHLHADPQGDLRNERYPAGSLVEVDREFLSWDAAIDAAFVPTDLDRNLDGLKKLPWDRQRIGEDGKVCDPLLVRERAAFAYLAAHEGETATVSYVDPAAANESNRYVFRVEGVLTRKVVRYPSFDRENPGVGRTVTGFLVGDGVVPLAGLSSIHVEGDYSVCVL